MCELRLRKMNDKSAKKDILISRLRGEIDDDAPPNEALGVFKSEAKAYEKGITRLLADMEKKLAEDEDTDADDKKSKEKKKGDKEKDGDENGNGNGNGN